MRLSSIIRKDLIFSAAAAGAFMASYLGAVIAYNTVELSDGARVSLALLPAIAFLLFIVAEVRLIRRCDELQQRIQLEALAVTYPLAIAIVMVFTLLQKSGLREMEPKWGYLPITYFFGPAIPGGSTGERFSLSVA
jgi:hypothetical protein